MTLGPGLTSCQKLRTLKGSKFKTSPEPTASTDPHTNTAIRFVFFGRIPFREGAGSALKLYGS